MDTIVRGTLTLVFIVFADASLARAKPSWADKPDTASRRGHTFVCEGEGSTEEAALRAAQAICNDKICRVCGVEVESVVETTETLQGVDMQRKVVERCRRFRKGAPTIQYKASECGPDGCFSWIQVFYSKEEEERDCKAFSVESFADPTECESLIEQFRQVAGRTAESFRQRTRLLDRALAACQNIDVRPTPAIMALYAKLVAGIDAFEWPLEAQRKPSSFGRATWTYFLPAQKDFRDTLDQTKLLIDRIRQVRDLVANKALVFDCLEAAQSKDLDSTTGITRLLQTMRNAPPGAQYGAPVTHIFILQYLGSVKTDTRPIGEFLRAIYPAHMVGSKEAVPIVSFFAHDNQVEVSEWDYAVQALGRHKLSGRLQPLLAAQDHGGLNIRLKRFSFALRSIKDEQPNRTPRRMLHALLSYKDPMFTFQHLEPSLDTALKKEFDFDLVHEFAKRMTYPYQNPSDKQTQHRLVRAVVSEIETDPKQQCRQLHSRMETLAKFRADTKALDAWVCRCIHGPLAKDSVQSTHRGGLIRYARKHKLGCL